MLLAASLVPWFVGRLGQKRTFVFAGFSGSVIALGVAFAPSSNPLWGIHAYGLLGLPFGLPAITLIVAASIMLAYPLTKKAYRRIIGEIADRRPLEDSYHERGPLHD